MTKIELYCAETELMLIAEIDMVKDAWKKSCEAGEPHLVLAASLLHLQQSLDILRDLCCDNKITIDEDYVMYQDAMVMTEIYMAFDE